MLLNIKNNCIVMILSLIVILIIFVLYKLSLNIFIIKTDDHANIIHKLLQNIICKLNKYNIPYTMMGGTLLGSVRHNGLIPWDHDADIAVIDVKLTEVLKMLNDELKDTGIECYLNWSNNIIKVKYINTKIILDIFLLEYVDNRYQFSYPYNKKYPTQWFYPNELFPLKQYMFGPLILNGPNVYINYLHRTYPDWDNKAVSWYSKLPLFKFDKTNININEPLLPTYNYKQFKCK